MNVLFIGDVVGRPGRNAVARWLPELRSEFAIDFVVANGENAAGGLGATDAVLDELRDTGVQAVTLGNHTWRKKEFVRTIDSLDYVVRPANYRPGVPGCGSNVFGTVNGPAVGVVNVVGRVFMEPVDCPFEAARREVDRLRQETPVVVVDVHAEATSEKIAMGHYLDGSCAAVIGTHTHVQTADEQVLPGGTAYITDVGMTGPADSVLGVEKELVLQKFLTGMPSTFSVAKGPQLLSAVVIEVAEETGRAKAIRRIQRSSA